jgi:hypothetical protein
VDGSGCIDWEGIDFRREYVFRVRVWVSIDFTAMRSDGVYDCGNDTVYTLEQFCDFLISLVVAGAGMRPPFAFPT